MQISRSAYVGGTCVESLVMEGVNALVQEGMAVTPGLTWPVAPTDSVVYAVSEEGDPIGVICYEYHHGLFNVTLAYVEPSSRRLKVMTRLWAAMEDDARKAHVGNIRLSVHARNPAALAFTKKIGCSVAVFGLNQKL